MEPPVPASTSGSSITLHKIFPIPQSWWPTFLQGSKTPHNVFEFIATSTRHWTSNVGKEATSKARMWARSACMADVCDPDTSTLAIHVNVDEGDMETISWATQHL